MFRKCYLKTKKVVRMLINENVMRKINETVSFINQIKEIKMQMQFTILY